MLRFLIGKYLILYSEDLLLICMRKRIIVIYQMVQQSGSRTHEHQRPICLGPCLQLCEDFCKVTSSAGKTSNNKNFHVKYIQIYSYNLPCDICSVNLSHRQGTVFLRARVKRIRVNSSGIRNPTYIHCVVYPPIYRLSSYYLSIKMIPSTYVSKYVNFAWLWTRRNKHTALQENSPRNPTQVLHRN